MRRALSIAVVLVALPALLLLPGSRIDQVVAEPAPKEKMSPVVKKLLQERVDVLKRALKSRQERMRVDPNGPGPDAVVWVARRLRTAELALAAKPADRIAAHLAYFKFVCEFDDRTISLYESGMFAQPDVLLVRDARLAAEIDLRQAGGTPPKEIKPPREIKEPGKAKRR
jgi:hypothetical protein